MTRAEGALVRARHLLWIVTALLVLGGGLAIAFIMIGRESNRADSLAQEAELRGTAVSTLAGDVRALRQQVKQAGKTPVAPDPTAAVDDLPARAQVPVPVPGPEGKQGTRGPAGKRGASGAPGQRGETGTSGAGSTVPGPSGQAGPPGPAGPAGAPGQDATGAPGKDGTDGRDGADGQTCPSGYTLTTPSYDPDALVCRKDGAPPPTDTGQPAPQTAALDPRRRYLFA